MTMTTTTIIKHHRSTSGPWPTITHSLHRLAVIDDAESRAKMVTRLPQYALTLMLLLLSVAICTVSGFTRTAPFALCNGFTSSALAAAAAESTESAAVTSTSAAHDSTNERFEQFVDFLQDKQTEIIQQLEAREAALSSAASFSRDAWGVFASKDANNNNTMTNGGITRVMQGGSIIEKGACSLTVIRQGVLTADRAATIRSRQATDSNNSIIQEGDRYAAAALSMVLHSASPMVPTFRSDVRVFLVHAANGGETLAWYGGGADLTPYLLFPDDIQFFHEQYRRLCDTHSLQENNNDTFSYGTMKQACDDYFYLPARAEHRGTGGIFFDDMVVTAGSTAFVQGVVNVWMPSWFPILDRRQSLAYTDQQKQWQLLRRGRYLEFNLLYDRGVKFGLANANPRVEGVMVSAPPLIAFEYNHKVEAGSPEAELMQILKEPRDWA
jgi:coproporphyrinogen III oxidase